MPVVGNFLIRLVHFFAHPLPSIYAFGLTPSPHIICEGNMRYDVISTLYGTHRHILNENKNIMIDISTYNCLVDLRIHRKLDLSKLERLLLSQESCLISRSRSDCSAYTDNTVLTTGVLLLSGSFGYILELKHIRKFYTIK